MEMRINRVLSFILIATSILALAGCASVDADVLNNSDAVLYYSEEPVDPLNYTMYTNKEIDLVLNELSTHIANADSLSKGRYVLSDEITAVEDSINSVQSAIDSVESINPPDAYEDDREIILQRMTNAKDSLTSYLSALKDDKTDDLSAYIDLMHGDYVALSGTFNMMWD